MNFDVGARIKELRLARGFIDACKQNKLLKEGSTYGYAYWTIYICCKLSSLVLV